VGYSVAGYWILSVIYADVSNSGSIFTFTSVDAGSHDQE
jgi:hypothetical protein